MWNFLVIKYILLSWFGDSLNVWFGRKFRLPAAQPGFIVSETQWGTYLWLSPQGSMAHQWESQGWIRFSILNVMFFLPHLSRWYGTSLYLVIESGVKNNLEYICTYLIGFYYQIIKVCSLGFYFPSNGTRQQGQKILEYIQIKFINDNHMQWFSNQQVVKILVVTSEWWYYMNKKKWEKKMVCICVYARVCVHVQITCWPKAQSKYRPTFLKVYSMVHSFKRF